MADTFKVLSQTAPLAATLTDSYTVPPATEAIISTITAVERSGVATSIRISIAVAGAVDAVAQYIVYDLPIAANETKTFTLGITLAATDVVRVYATLATVSFGIFGVEKT